MRVAIRNLMHWSCLKNPASGYTVVIACMRDLMPILAATLRLLMRMHRANCRELILVFDCTQSEFGEDDVEQIRAICKDAPVRLIFYSPEQVSICRQINWGWVYSWLSWCTGLSAATTTHVILHDLDALVLDPLFFERIYGDALKSQAQFHGIRWYHGNGIRRSMRLVTTFELVLDATYVRRYFSPIDVFNRACLVGGKYVDFDTFLYVQWQSPVRDVSPIDERQLVHPSQLVCDYVSLRSGKTDRISRRHNLAMLPYYFYLGGEERLLQESLRSGFSKNGRDLSLLGRRLPLSDVPPEHWAWKEKQIRRVEQALFQRTREPVEEYLNGFIARAGDKRTVGRELLDEGGIEAR